MLPQHFPNFETEVLSGTSPKTMHVGASCLREAAHLSGQPSMGCTVRWWVHHRRDFRSWRGHRWWCRWSSTGRIILGSSSWNRGRWVCWVCSWGARWGCWYGCCGWGCWYGCCACWCCWRGCSWGWLCRCWNHIAGSDLRSGGGRFAIFGIAQVRARRRRHQISQKTLGPWFFHHCLQQWQRLDNIRHSIFWNSDMIPKDLGGRGAKPRHVKFSSGMNTGCKPFIFLQTDFGG